ncbi:hypothetical protein DPMN_022095 [Dreissena polymorpha]|uniref:Uncharacterized protein n=1 Tax=Dreissena polymorpha TaxID=45954 RepID=A0A9D4S9T0_DREPO|nr:hypothetical protein DPMN_022095 [Dreissena polymorpha]
MTPIDFQVTRYIDHDSQMTPIDFQVTSLDDLVWVFLKGDISYHLTHTNTCSSTGSLLMERTGRGSCLNSNWPSVDLIISAQDTAIAHEKARSPGDRNL